MNNKNLIQNTIALLELDEGNRSLERNLILLKTKNGPLPILINFKAYDPLYIFSGSKLTIDDELDFLWDSVDWNNVSEL